MEGEAHHLSYAYTKPCCCALQRAASTPMACTATRAAPCSAEVQITPTTSVNRVMLLSLALLLGPPPTPAQIRHQFRVWG
jgi:hypothetical protein